MMKKQTVYFAVATIGLGLLVGLQPAWAAAFRINSYDDSFPGNQRGGNANTYQQAPSSITIRRGAAPAASGGGCLMLTYDKKGQGQGGPFNSGGWCGFYELLSPQKKWFNASQYQYITVWVRGQTGNENFMIGVSDRTWYDRGDSYKSGPIGNYVPAGRLTTQWQKAVIPLNSFAVNLSELASISYSFEGSLYPGGAGKGTVYVDELYLE